MAALEKEHREASEAGAGRAAGEPDQTIEILMSDLDPNVMSIFTRAHSASAHHATKVHTTPHTGRVNPTCSLCTSQYKISINIINSV